ncbi:GtrA family protein [Marinicella meishanensis]|uniref:GtrA family protein n=1 Tax=Marinicella meishanensis TaxID=2873263 RepID=UPI001CBFDC84|nr:GtrA family protein [Marinicella sp. NBU2979]
MSSYKSLFALMVRYGMVGVLASLIHAGISLAVLAVFDIEPFWSHAIGFFGGLITAYLGHYHYSFKDDGAHKQRFPKFAITAGTGFALHQSGVYLLVNQLQLTYQTQALPLLMVTVPMVTFLMSKFWVFRNNPH